MGTNLKEWNKIKDNVSQRESDILNVALVLNRPVSLDDISLRLGCQPHEISGRISELKRKQILVVHSKGTNQKGNPCAFYSYKKFHISAHQSIAEEEMINC